MKKLIFSALCLWLMAVGKASADNTLSVADVTIPKGGQVKMEIVCDFETVFLGCQFNLVLGDDGMVFPAMSSGKPVIELGFSDTEHSVTRKQLKDTNNELLPEYGFVCASLSNDVLPTSGTLFRIPLNASADATVGNTYQVKLSNIEFTDTEKHVVKMNDVSFTITIGEPVDTRTVLNENSTKVPDAATGVDVRVIRTIAANTWSTICLPFAMSETQVKVAFGNDVQLGNFTGYSVDAEGKISVAFNQVNAIAKNHPYIIKVSTAIDEFLVDNVDIDPSMSTVSCGALYMGNFGSFTGTYQAGTEIAAQCLFLNNNEFWYSTGKTKSKAYRAFFYFQYILDSYNTATTTSARMTINLNAEATGVYDAKQAVETNDRIYNLQGQQVEQPGKGLYIKNGKVIMNK